MISYAGMHGRYHDHCPREETATGPRPHHALTAPRAREQHAIQAGMNGLPDQNPSPGTASPTALAADLNQ